MWMDMTRDVLLCVLKKGPWFNSSYNSDAPGSRHSANFDKKVHKCVSDSSSPQNEKRLSYRKQKNAWDLS